MRVIAGSCRGRLLRAPAGTVTRPTSDRVREAIFDVLGSLVDLDGMAVADLFAGSGAMGIEALSRGAASAVFVDNAPAALRAIAGQPGRPGPRRTGPGSCARTCCASSTGPTTSTSPCATRPTTSRPGTRLLTRLRASLAVLESRRPVEVPAGWEIIRNKRYGGTLVTVVRSLGAHAERHLVTVALFPGSFDPFHNGHLEVVERAGQLFDEVVVATLRNPQKAEPLFSLDEREEMLQDSLAHSPTCGSCRWPPWW